MSTKKELPPHEEAQSEKSLCSNNNTKQDKKQQKTKKNSAEWEMPDLKSKALQEIVKKKARHFNVVVYPESAPSDWISALCELGIPFAISPLHDKDTNPDGTKKKEHYHVLFSYANTTTLKAFAECVMPMLHCPLPQVCASPRGMYKYFTHADNPEKYQYESSEIQSYCGFEIPIDSKDVRDIMQAIEYYAIENGVLEYAEMSIICSRISIEWYNVFSTHTVHFGKFMSSLRHNYEHVAKVYRNLMNEEDNQNG